MPALISTRLHTLQWDDAAFTAAAGDGDTITFDQWAVAFHPCIGVRATREQFHATNTSMNHPEKIHFTQTFRHNTIRVSHAHIYLGIEKGSRGSNTRFRTQQAVEVAPKFARVKQLQLAFVFLNNVGVAVCFLTRYTIS